MLKIIEIDRDGRRRVGVAVSRGRARLAIGARGASVIAPTEFARTALTADEARDLGQALIEAAGLVDAQVHRAKELGHDRGRRGCTFATGDELEIPEYHEAYQEGAREKAKADARLVAPIIARGLNRRREEEGGLK